MVRCRSKNFWDSGLDGYYVRNGETNAFAQISFSAG